MDPTSPDSLPMLASIIATFVYMQKLLRAVKLLHILYNFRQHNRKRWGGRRAMERRFIRQVHIRRIISDSDLACYENTRMDRKTFHAHCDLLSTRGRLQETRELPIGKDHTIGADAESALDTARNIDEEEELMTHASTQDLDVEMLFMEQSSARINTSNVGTSAKSKKRKSPLGEDAFNEQFCSTLRSLETSFTGANQHLGRLANCFQFMANNESKKEKLFEEIVKIEGLEDRQVMDATEILMGDSTKIDTFYCMPDHYRKQYIFRVLGGRD